MSRNLQVVRLLGLVTDLSATRHGVLLEDLLQKHGVSRRTLERDMDALRELGYAVATLPDEGSGRLRKRIITREDRALFPFTSNELAAAHAAAQVMAHEAPPAVAAIFRVLLERLEQLQPPAIRVDGAALSAAQASIGRPGHRARIDARLLAELQRAIIACCRVLVTYHKGGASLGREYLVEPYGLLLGGKGYLVWRGEDGKFRKFSLPDITDVQATVEGFAIDPDFVLAAYAAQSVGVMADETMDVELRITPEGRPRLRTHVFHSTQVISELPDGSAVVRFQASGQQELCWQLFTWGDQIRVIRPERLQTTYASMLRDALTVAGDAQLQAPQYASAPAAWETAA